MTLQQFGFGFYTSLVAAQVTEEEELYDLGANPYELDNVLVGGGTGAVPFREEMQKLEENGRTKVRCFRLPFTIDETSYFETGTD